MKIIIVHKPSLIREGMVNVLRERYPDDTIEVMDIGEYAGLDCEEEIADLVIVGLETDRKAPADLAFFKTRSRKVAVWASQVNENQLIDAFKLNVGGYFFNEMEKEEVLSAVDAMLKGQIYIHAAFLPILLDDYERVNKKEDGNRIASKPPGMLSQREWDILELLVSGATNEEMAETLEISYKTVKNHMTHLLKKLGVTNRTHAVLTALEKKWFSV